MTDDKRQKVLQIGEVNVQNQTLFAVAVPRNYNDDRLTIMIGSGGSGIDAILDAKKSADNILRENYRNQVMFIAVDADGKKLRQAERCGVATINLSRSGATDRISKYNYRDSFFKAWMPANFSVNFDDEGSNQRRMVGKAKFYDESDGSYVNVLFRNKLREIIQGWGAYQGLPIDIIIASGLAGGTGSGTFIDLAVNARIACAAQGRTAQIYSYLFLADTVEEFNQNITDLNSVYTNCYAALKETESYQCLRQNSKRKEVFQVRDGASKEFDSVSPVFDRVILVSGSYKGSKRIVAECLADLLSDTGGAFGHAVFYSNADTYRSNKLNGAMNAGMVKEGFFPEDSHSYCAIGMATASIPEEVVVANVVSHVCERLYQEPPLTIHESGQVLTEYFREQDKVLNRIDAEKEVRRLYGWGDNIKLETGLLWKGIDDMIKDRVRLMQSKIEITIDQINAGDTAQFIAGYNATARMNQAVEEIRDHFRDMYLDFENKASAFMQKYGPRAFLSLYYGRGPANEKGVLLDFHDISLLNMMETAQNGIYDVSMEVIGDSQSTIKRGMLGHGNKAKIADWKSRTKAIEEKKIRKEVCGKLRGESGLFGTEYVSRVKGFVSLVESFTLNLEELISFYHNEGLVLEQEKLSEFTAKISGDVNVNLCDEPDIFDWVKQEAGKTVDDVDIRALRRELIDDFMKNKEQWVSEVVGVARKRFDRILSKACGIGKEAALDGKKLDLSVERYFEKKLEKVEEKNMSEEVDRIIKPIISQLLNKSRPALLAEGVVSVAVNRFILVPTSLVNSSNGKIIKNSIENAISKKDVITRTAESDSVTKIVCYQTSVANALYDIKGIDVWEKAYDASVSGCDMVHLSNGELPGRYVETVYEKGETEQEKYIFGTNLSWRHYPPLALHRKHRLGSDESAEKRFLKNCFDPIFDYALKNRIIERVGDMQNGFSYVVYIIPHSWKKIDISGYQSKELGENLFRYLSGLPQNRAGGETEFKRMLQLEDSGIYSMRLDPSEAVAVHMAEDEILRRYDSYARAILRRNTQLFCELRYTLNQFAAIKDDLAKAIEAKRMKEDCGVFIDALISGVIQRSGNVWKVMRDNKNFEEFLNNDKFSRVTFSAFWKELYQKKMHLPLVFYAFRNSDMCQHNIGQLKKIIESNHKKFDIDRERYERMLQERIDDFQDGMDLYDREYLPIPEDDRGEKLRNDYGCDELDSLAIVQIYDQWRESIAE